MHYRLFFDKAKENLKASQLCFDHGLFNACVNRAYYAMFHAAVAALANEGIVPTEEVIKHGWLQATFASELVHRRKIYPGFANYLPDAADRREEADYQLVFFTQRKAKRALDSARQFVERIEKELSR